MSSSVMRPLGTRSPVDSHRGSPKHHHPVHTSWLVASVVVAVALGVGGWALVARLTSSGAPVVSSGYVASGDVSLVSVEVAALQRQLHSAGYSIPVTGMLDAVTKSAAGDALGAVAMREQSALVQRALANTVLTGRHDAAAWNARFGLNRLTSMVERPLTGPGGQLDAAGNLRSP